MSGVNAHAILQGAPAGSPKADLPGHGGLIWQRARHWVCPAAHQLLRSFAASTANATATLVADLCAPALAYLRDHQVRGSQHLCAHDVSHLLQVVLALSHQACPP